MRGASFRPFRLACLALVIAAATCRAETASVMEWTVDGVQREALVVPPAKTSDAGVPVMLVFHGHGGTMRFMERKGFHKHWPEAVVVYCQGLPTRTRLDPTGKRPGWQPRVGDNNDRDLKFVDAILKTLREKYKVDDRRIYATGHSNGGGFTYALWAARGKEFAALAPLAAGIGGVRTVQDLKPLPVLHLAGEKDEIVKFANQTLTMETVRKINGCDPTGTAWTTAGNLVGTLYASKNGAPFVSLIHPGGHELPAEASELVVKFFKEQAKPQAAK
jgi:polyhydroxybutyrate depolymerase